MGIEHILILLVTGIIVGFAAGMLGLGGGFLMAPVQYMVYSSMGLPSDIATKMAFGTTLLAILPTAASGAWAHHKKRAVWWRAAIFMGIFTFIGSYTGATIAANIPGVVLRMAFGVIAVGVSIRMVTAKISPVEQEVRDNLWLWVAIALPLGILTGILGVGGGILLVPIMVLGLRFKMHTAIATSLAMMLLTASGGAIGYIVNGMKVPDLPPYSLGYVNLVSFFILSVSSIGMARFGAAAAHRMPAKQLNYVFSAITFIMGLKMLGVFQWLGLPF
ncbi:MAG: sulfite exporter TauE/SafE family protein [Dehalococcoidia bacterium]|nr:sulfite exporter TauE/SafE family protein [Dehalococcoidia bacterium]